MRWVGLLVGLGGVALLLGPGAAGGDPWAVAQVLLAALGYAAAPIIADRCAAGRARHPADGHLPRRHGARATRPSCSSTGPHAVAAGRRACWPSSALGALCTALAFVLFFRLIVEVGAARSTLVAYLNPVVAVALGALVLDEAITVTVLAATALILVGSAAASRRTRREPAPTTSTSVDRGRCRRPTEVESTPT